MDGADDDWTLLNGGSSQSGNNGNTESGAALYPTLPELHPGKYSTTNVTLFFCVAFASFSLEFVYIQVTLVNQLNTMFFYFRSENRKGSESDASYGFQR